MNRQTGPVASSVKKLSKPRARGQGATRGRSGRRIATSQTYREAVPYQEPVFRPPLPSPPAYSGRGRGAGRGRGRGFSFSSRRPRRGRR
ncbi:MAG: hypothetical protein ABW185_14860 [Sedimenticola sp.]